MHWFAAALALMVSGHRRVPAQLPAHRLAINLDRQQMIEYRPGKSLRRYRISSGSGRWYRNPKTGRKARAVTPRGHFRINRKITGWRESSSGLGMMYYPMYFDGGFAIHGGNARRPRRSHGCVRVSLRSIIRLFQRTPIGTDVYIQ